MKSLRLLLATLLFFLWAAPSGICSQYIVTEQQLTKLEVNLITLSKFNAQLQVQVDELNRQLKAAEQASTNASLSFEKFEKTQHRKLNRSKFRVVLTAIGSALAIAVFR